MDRASFAVPEPTRTAGATFKITFLDIGSPAVRPGCMAAIEEERAVLLAAAKLVLKRIRDGKINIGAVQEYALESAIRLAELPR